MAKIIFEGWNVGLKKISLNLVLSDKAGLSTGEAHELIQEVISGTVCAIEVSDMSIAEDIAKQARELGAIVRIEGEWPTSSEVESR